MLKKVCTTARLIRFALLPAVGLAADVPEENGSAGKAAPMPDRRDFGAGTVCTPDRIRGGFGRLLNDRGELSLCFPDCLALAAPAVLFRLKREGFSECRVGGSEQGLLVQGRR